MKKILFAFILLLPSLLSAQMISYKAKNFEQYRQTGDIRQWTIIVRDSAIGILQSKVVEKSKINGISGYKIYEKLILDYNKIGINKKLAIDGDFFAAGDGFYLGDDKSITSNENTERLKLTRDGSLLKGFFTRSGDKIPVETNIYENVFSFDNNFYDQLELNLAFNDLIVGENIEFDYLEPQTQLLSKFYGVVEEFSYKQIHTRLADSVFLINVFQPLPMTIYFSNQKKLQKIDIPSLKTKIYLDQVITQPKQPVLQKSVDFSKIIKLIPNYLLSMVFGLMGIALFIGSSFRQKIVYISFAGGIVLFVINSFIQYPIQQYFTESFLVPALKNGESIFLLAIVPSLFAGVIQEFLKFGGIFALLKKSNSKPYLFLVVGMMLGAGFGIAEGIYLDTVIGRTAFSWNLFERAFVILFHVSSGGLLGYAVGDISKRLAMTIIPLVIVNSFIRYLPLFVQVQKADSELMYIILSALSLTVLIFTLIFSKK